MENDDKVKVAATLRKKRISPVLTQSEMRKLVKSFVMSWLTGEIEIAFPSAHELEKKAKMEGEIGLFKKPKESFFDQEYDMQEPFIKNVSIFLGKTTASDEERLCAMNALFDTLIELRAVQRIKGKITDSLDMDARLSRLERDMYRTKELLEEMKDLIKRGLIK